MSVPILINLFLNQPFRMKSIHEELPWNFEWLRLTNRFWGFVLSSAVEINIYIYLFIWLLKYIILCVFPSVLDKPGYHRLESTVGVISQKIATLRQGTSWCEIGGTICCSSIHKRHISKTLSAEAHEIFINFFALFVGENGLFIFKEEGPR